jgi:hypothetical protein
MTTKYFKKESEDKEDTNKLAESIFSKIGVEMDDQQSKTKTSFYITRLTQNLLKTVSDTYGISQGDMIGWTPLIFANVAQQSLERRKRSIATLRTLEQQIQSSIDAMISVAPHLSLLLHYPSEMIYQLVDAEENAVEKKVISGLGVKEFDEGLFSVLNEPFESEPAYQRELDEAMGNMEEAGDLIVNALKNLLKKEAGDEHKDDKPRTNSD